MSLVWVLWPKKFRKTWQTPILMLRSLNLHQKATFLHDFNTLNEHRFYPDYLQIPYRHSNDIKHSFIFKKGFIKCFSSHNGITRYILPFHYRLMSRYNSTTFLPSFLPHSDWILSMSFSLNLSVFPLQISTIWAGLSVILQPMCHSPFSISTLALLLSSYIIFSSPIPMCISAEPLTKFHSSLRCSCLCIDRHENGSITNSLTLNPSPKYKSL